MSDRVYFSNINSLNMILFSQLTRFGKLSFFNFSSSFLSPEAFRSTGCIGCKLIFLANVIIFRGENQLAGWHKTKKAMEFWYSQATKGFNNNKICLQYMEKIFEPETKNR